MQDVIRNLKYRIGCSGFHYEEWKEKFYPVGLPKTKWFEFYNEHFNTVELNVTFYRNMKNSFFENLYLRSKENFLFSVKASRIITHYKKFNDTIQILNDFYLSVQQGLKEKLGCILFQLPPNYQYKKEHLERIIEQMDPGFKNTIEFRHESWWTKTVYDELQKNKICFCSVSYPGIPDTFILNGEMAYIRLHGVPVLYRSTYTPEFLYNLAQRLEKAQHVKQAFIYFDNTATGAAIFNAKEISKILRI